MVYVNCSRVFCAIVCLSLLFVWKYFFAAQQFCPSLVGNMKIIESCGITDFTFCFFYLLLLVRVEEYMPNGPRKRK